MRKKIAFLLAAIMVLTALPMSASANVHNLGGGNTWGIAGTAQISNYGDRTIVLDQTLNANSATTVLANSARQFGAGTAAANWNQTLHPANLGQGMSLVLRIQSTGAQNTQFTVSLENAIWAFAANRADNTVNLSNEPFQSTTPANSTFNVPNFTDIQWMYPNATDTAQFPAFADRNVNGVRSVRGFSTVGGGGGLTLAEQLSLNNFTDQLFTVMSGWVPVATPGDLAPTDFLAGFRAERLGMIATAAALAGVDPGIVPAIQAAITQAIWDELFLALWNHARLNPVGAWSGELMPGLNTITAIHAANMATGSVLSRMELQIGPWALQATQDAYHGFRNLAARANLAVFRVANTGVITNNLAVQAAFRAGGPIVAGYFGNATYQSIRDQFAMMHNLTSSVPAPNSPIQLVGYTLSVDPYNRHSARITIGTRYDGSAPQVNDIIIIPLVFMTLSQDNPVAFSLMSPTPAISNINRAVLGGTGVVWNQTRTEFRSVVSAARGRVYLSNFTITETVPNIMQTGTFVLIPPVDYNLVRLHQPGTTTMFTTGTPGPASHLVSRTFGLDQLTITAINAISVTPWENPPAGDWNHVRPRQAQAISINIPGGARNMAGTIEMRGFALAPLSNDPELWANIGDTLSITIASWGTTDAQGSQFLRPHNLGFQVLAPIAEGGSAVWTQAPHASWLPTLDRTSARVTRQTPQVAVREDWNITMTAGTPTQVFSGLVNQATAAVTVRETTMDSWNTRQDTIFTVTNAAGVVLPDVKISRVEVTGGAATRTLRAVTGALFENTAAFGAHPTAPNAGFWNADRHNPDPRAVLSGTPLMFQNSSFSRNGHSFILTDLHTNAHDFAQIQLTFHLSAAANFDGPVFISMTGPAIGNQTVQPVQVADFAPPVIINTEPTEVNIGFQRFRVADIEIVENFDRFNRSSVRTGQQLWVTLGEFGNGRLTDQMNFVPLSRANVHLGDDPMFNISEVSLVNIPGAGVGGTFQPRALQFTVTRGAGQVGGRILLTNVEVNIDRTVPEGFYDLVVGGPTIVNNTIPSGGFLYMFDRFDVWGVVFPNFIQMVTEGYHRAGLNTVEVPFASGNTVWVNGVEQQLPDPVLNVDGRLFIPIRWISTLLGVPENNIHWDDGSRRVVIITPDRTVTFQQDSSSYWINNVELVMSVDGQIVEAFIDPVFNRMYIPFRFLAYGLGIQVEADHYLQMAIFNPVR